MISIFCKQCRDDKYYDIKLIFSESELLGLVVIDDVEIHYGFILKGWVGHWMYIEKLDYGMLREVLKFNETKQL